MRRPPLFAALAAAVLLAPAVPAAGQVLLNDLGPDGTPPGPEVVELTVSPAPLPSPPLEYRLTIPPEDRVAGNAVTFWYRSQILMLEVDRLFRERDAEQRSLGYAASVLAGEPPAALTAERIEAEFNLDLEGWSLFENLRAAARRPGADWDYGLAGLTGREAVNFLLPEFQNARDLAQLGLLRGRSRLGRGDFRGALADAAVNLRLAEDCGAGPFVICDLVGVAVQTLTLAYLVEPVVAAPDSPNLYYALSELPDPAAGLADSWEAEFSLPYRLAPWLAGAADRDRPAERWEVLWEKLFADLRALNRSLASPPDGPDPALTAAAMLAAEAPDARRSLIEAALSADRVAAMPDGQAVAAAWDRELRGTVDRFRLAAVLPLREAAAAFAVEGERLGGRAAVLKAFLPAARQAALAGLRARTDLAALRVIEALRAHAAAAGAFPASLNTITVADVPANPLTGEAFGYRLDGGVAVLDVDRHPGDSGSDRVFRLALRPAE